MGYVDAIVVAVPRAHRAAYLAFANASNPVFLAHGAIRVVDCWAESVPHGKQTDLYRAVAATQDEDVVFGWIEWPDKATRDAGWAAVMADPRLAPAANPPPFDGKRMIFGGFDVISDAISDAKGSD